MVLVAVWFMVRYWHPGESVLPAEVVGTWTTTAPGYEDRKIQFQPTQLRFYTGPAAFSTHDVRRVQSTGRTGVTIYTVDYGSADGTATLTFQYVSGRRPAIRLRHQTFVWWRERR